MATILCLIDSATGNIWFKAKEIAEYLGYKDTTKSIDHAVHREDKTTFDVIRMSHGGNHIPCPHYNQI
jgi:prophage antirepressor-like protein